MENNRGTPLDELAREAGELWKEPLGDKPIEFAKTSLLDWLGVAIAGSRHSGPVLRRIGTLSAGDSPAAGFATVIGNGRSSDPVTAALHNGIAGHILDYDDVLISRHQPLHPTAPIAPALLAIAESRSASGGDLLRALVVGVESVSRLANAIDGSHFAHGWHISATLGTVGASIGAGLLLGLSPQQLRHAIWLGATQMAGLRVALGTFAKPLQVGKSASTGLTCALLAEADAPLDQCIEQEDWLRSAYSIGNETEPPARGPKRFAIETVLYKRYPCCGEAHDAINSVLHMPEPPPWQSLRKIRIFAPAASVLLAGVLKPGNGMAARFSIPYCTSAALVRRRVSLAEFSQEAVLDPGIAGLLQRTELIPHGARGTRVEMELQDGSTLSAKPDVARNIRDIAGRRDFVCEKFAENAAPLIGRAACEQLMGLVLGLDQDATVRQLSETLRRIA